MHCSGVTSDNGTAVNGPAVTSRNCVLDHRKNETLDVVTSKYTHRLSGKLIIAVYAAYVYVYNNATLTTNVLQNLTFR